MDRQRISEELGALEEHLELVQRLSMRNSLNPIQPKSSFDFEESIQAEVARESLDRLHQELSRQREQKSISVEKLLQKIAAILIQEVLPHDRDITISTFGSGNVSLEMVELAMGSIVGAVRASVRSALEFDSLDRQRLFLYPALSFFIHAKSEGENIHFILKDDGAGHSNLGVTGFEQEKDFQKIRAHLAVSGGWFRKTNLVPYGGKIEFRLPLIQPRFLSYRVVSNGIEALIPATCVASLNSGVASRDRVVVLDENSGMAVSKGLAQEQEVEVQLAIADYEFPFRCRVLGEGIRTRKLSGADFFDPSSSFQYLGVFHEAENPKVLPLLEGETLLNFYQSVWSVQ